MGKIKEPFVPALVEEISEGKYRVFNLIPEWSNVIGIGKSIEEAIESYKESVQDAIEISGGKTVLKHIPRFFVEEKRRKLDFSLKFLPVLIYEKYLENYSLFIAGMFFYFSKRF